MPNLQSFGAVVKLDLQRPTGREHDGGAMVDYSKWDRMDLGSSSSSSEEDDDDGTTTTAMAGPRPAPFPAVTIGPDGLLSLHAGGGGGVPRTSSSSSSSIGRDASDGVTVVDVASSSSSSSSREEEDDRWLIHATRDGGSCRAAARDDDADAYSNNTTSTSTTPKSSASCCTGLTPVLVSGSTIDRPASAFPRVDFACPGTLSYADRHSAVGGDERRDADDDDDDDDGPSCGSVEVVSLSPPSGGGGGNRHAFGRLPHEVDYEIEECRICHRPYSRPLVVVVMPRNATGSSAITLPKAVPMDGMTIWWDRPLVGYPRIDVTAIRGRGWGRVRGGRGGGGATTTREDDGRKDEDGRGGKNRKEEGVDFRG
ncbi:hypothetical protein ACHAW5_003675 [Stephanodiscus triporus]|uniref:Uncharacterized protein n=1 Tax=Stephanodiscus triporus TaxID=2934178 RepID=A0ABD3PX14_9STRA